MTALKEKFANFGVDDDGDIVPLEDYGKFPVDNASITQGIENFEKARYLDRLLREDEVSQRKRREQAVTDAGLKNAGVYVTLDEHRQNQIDLSYLVGDITQYRGGEKGGFKSTEFLERYGIDSADVATGAMKNHRALVHKVLPKIYKADELKAAGFDEFDVDFDAKTTMRVELMKDYGGPGKKKERAAWRARYKQ